MAAAEDRFVFIVEWYDNMASLMRPYQLMYFPKDNTIEMYDIKNKKLFLKRSEYPSVSLKDLYIGSTITVYSRQLKVVDYGDPFTKKNFETQRERTFGMIKPDCYPHIGKIIDIIEHSGFIIGNIKMARMSQQNAEEFYAEHKGKSFYSELATFICSDFVVGMELIADGAVAKWRKLIGPTNCQVARAEAPESLRALFGSEGVRNACHGSDSTTSAQRELDFFFGDRCKLKPTAFLSNCTCCLIKPHIVLEAQIGKVIDCILNEGFEISALQMFYLDKPTSEEFYDVYKGVVPEFTAMVTHLTTGPCIAIEVRQEEAVTAFRDVCGPSDSEVARSTKPNSIRAKFGVDKIKNAVHCTDLVEDGPLEVEFFFTILQYKS